MLSVKIDYGTGHVCILCQFSISTIIKQGISPYTFQLFFFFSIIE